MTQIDYDKVHEAATVANNSLLKQFTELATQLDDKLSAIDGQRESGVEAFRSAELVALKGVVTVKECPYPSGDLCEAIRQAQTKLTALQNLITQMQHGHRAIHASNDQIAQEAK